MQLKTILVGLALDEDSEKVVSRALQLAAQHNATIIGVHVIEDSALQDSDLLPSVNVSTLTRLIEDESRRKLESLFASQAENVLLHIESGKAYKVIEKVAALHDVDVIVIGPGTASGLREKLFGSTADYVVRYASCPVLVVRRNARMPYQHTTVGVDFSDCSREAALWASRLSPTAAMDLIYAFEIPLPFKQAMLKAGTLQADIDHYRNVKIAAARKRLLEIYGQNGRLPRGTLIHIVRGDAAMVLTDISRNDTTDLVALGTQGVNPIAQHLLGSVAREVINSAECDVLIVSPNGKTAPAQKSSGMDGQ